MCVYYLLTTGSCPPPCCMLSSVALAIIRLLDFINFRAHDSTQDVCKTNCRKTTVKRTLVTVEPVTHSHEEQYREVVAYSDDRLRRTISINTGILDDWFHRWTCSGAYLQWLLYNTTTCLKQPVSPGWNSGNALHWISATLPPVKSSQVGDLIEVTGIDRRTAPYR